MSKVRPALAPERDCPPAGPSCLPTLGSPNGPIPGDGSADTQRLEIRIGDWPEYEAEAGSLRRSHPDPRCQLLFPSVPGTPDPAFLNLPALRGPHPQGRGS
jgi:hypothetical protein